MKSSILANLAPYAYSMIFQPFCIATEKFRKDASDQGHLDIQKVKQIFLGEKECHSSGGMGWDLEIWKDSLRAHCSFAGLILEEDTATGLNNLETDDLYVNCEKPSG